MPTKQPIRLQVGQARQYCECCSMAVNLHGIVQCDLSEDMDDCLLHHLHVSMSAYKTQAAGLSESGVMYAPSAPLALESGFVSTVVFNQRFCCIPGRPPQS